MIQIELKSAHMSLHLFKRASVISNEPKWVQLLAQISQIMSKLPQTNLYRPKQTQMRQFEPKNTTYGQMRLNDFT